MSSPSLRLAFCLYRYTPFGGLERNCLAIAQACARRGQRVEVFTRGWEGERPGELAIHELSVRALTNVGRDRAFASALEPRVRAGGFDAVVGFNRLPFLDVFYAADPCFAATRGKRARLVRLGRATRGAWERAIFRAGSTCEVLVQSECEARRYREHYGTEVERLHVLPPGLRPEFLTSDAGEDRARLRAELEIPARDLVLLFVGSDFTRKGLDRALRAFARLDERSRERAWLVVAGAGRPERFRRLADRLGLDTRARFLGGRTDVLALARAADLLLHPAREENTGGVLLEALSQAVPVVASGACGFAEHVERARAGAVLSEPFAPAELERVLAELLADDARRAQAGERGRAHVRGLELACRFELAADVIERAARRRANERSATIEAPATR